MRAEGIGQENRFAAIGTYGNDFPFIGLKSPNNTNRAVYQLNQPTDNRSITSNLDSGSKQHSGQEIMKIRLALSDVSRVLGSMSYVSTAPCRSLESICIPSSIFIYSFRPQNGQ